MTNVATAIFIETLYQQFLALGHTDTRAEFVVLILRVMESA